MNPRSSAAFWALTLILSGVIFLLQNLGILPGNVWGTIWPLFLVLLGLWMLLGHVVGRGQAAATTQAVPLDGAREAYVEVNHGAGELRVGSSGDTMKLVNSTADGGLIQRVRHDGDRVNVSLSQEHNWVLWTRCRSSWTFTRAPARRNSICAS